MLKQLYERYGFKILLVILIVIFFINLIFKNKGSYTNHNEMMWNLIQKSVVPKPKVAFESKGETECRRVIEKITERPFLRERPGFLRNEISGQNLEIDCFNSDLKLGIEYNGEQHYKFIPYFHKNKEAFQNLKYRDEMKQRLCKLNGVELIIVPYTVKDIEKFILYKLDNLDTTIIKKVI